MTKKSACYLILSLFLIGFGAGFAYLLLSGLFAFVTPFSFLGLLFYIPTLALCSALPLYAGIGMIVEIIKKKGNID